MEATLARLRRRWREWRCRHAWVFVEPGWGRYCVGCGRGERAVFAELGIDKWWFRWDDVIWAERRPLVWCEKCWGDAYHRMVSDPAAVKSQAEHYRDLLEERKDNPCSRREQAGASREHFE